MHIQDPWFTEILMGRKTVEGRVGSIPSKYAVYVGGQMKIECDNLSTIVKVNMIIHYQNLESYLRNEWRRAAPHVGSLEEARSAYMAILDEGFPVFSDERVKKNGGINAIYIELI